MLIYDNEYETKESKNWTKDKIKLQHVHKLSANDVKNKLLYFLD